MKKVYFFMLLFIVLYNSNVFAGSIPEDLLYNDNAQLFIGEVVSYNADKNVEVIVTESIKGGLKVGAGRIYYNPNTVTDTDSTANATTTPTRNFSGFSF